MNTISQLNHEAEFERAWADPGNTRYELPSVDINQVLTEHYRMSEPFTFTRTMLWDMEIHKAWRPDRYLPSVVQVGSADTWNKCSLNGGDESFLRLSQQRRWLEPAEYGLVLEQVYLNPSQQKVTFIGAVELSDGDESILHAGTRQPLFHVEHSVSGDESRPMNKWRIVHLTDKPEHKLIERFTGIANDVWLPEFIEIYIRVDLNTKLSRHDIA